LSNTPALSLQGITKKFGSLTALDNVSFNVERGMVHALLGENGAGKTTLMRIAFGLIRPDSGQIFVDDKPIRFRSPRDAIDAGLGMVHQQFSLIPAMTVAENIALGGNGHLASRDSSARIQALMDRTGLKLDPYATVASLSAAERQKLEILRTLAHDAKVLILDEPTAVLTEQDSIELFEQVKRYTEAGNSVVLITHKLRDALRHADQITVLRRGKVALASQAQAENESRLAEVMLGESDSGRSPARRSRDNSVNALLGIVMNTEIRRGEILGIAALEGAARPILDALTSKFSKELVVAFVPENRRDDALIENFTLVENFALSNAAGRKGVMNWESARADTQAVIDSFNVRTRGIQATPKELSGGNQQRFVLGRELTRQPDLLVLENPTQGLDLNAAAFVHEHLQQAARQGAAVVFYSSDLDELAERSDRVIVVSRNAVTPVAVERDAIGHALLAAP
jgi:simple sugar transport system ATP-binding protein